MEQDADMVLLLHRESMNNPDGNEGLVELIVGKNRHGEQPDVGLAFQGECLRFSNMV